MKVRELKDLLQGLPDDMEVVTPLQQDSYITVCYEKSGVIELAVAEDEEDDSGEPTDVLLLVGCDCDMDEEYTDGEINSQPKLN